MPGDVVHASPESIKRLAGALATYQQEVSAAGSRFRRSLAAADWHDRQKAALEGRYEELQKTIDKFMSNDVKTMIKSLNELAQKLSDIRSMGM